MTIKGVLFDFDGTLTLPGALDFPAIKRELGCPVDEPVLEFLETLPPSIRSELMKVLQEKEDIASEASRPNKGAEQCLSSFKKKGISIGILTRNSLGSVKKALKNFKSISYDDFKSIITRDFSLPKPHPDGVVKSARIMGLSPSELLMVGDFRFDVIAGNAAGSTTVLLTNGGESLMMPGDPEPDHIITSLDELLQFFNLSK